MCFRSVGRHTGKGFPVKLSIGATFDSTQNNLDILNNPPPFLPVDKKKILFGCDCVNLN